MDYACPQGEDEGQAPTPGGLLQHLGLRGGAPCPSTPGRGLRAGGIVSIHPWIGAQGRGTLSVHSWTGAQGRGGLPVHPRTGARALPPTVWGPQDTAAGLGGRQSWGPGTGKGACAWGRGNACTSARLPPPPTSSGKRPGCHGSFSRINSLDLIVKNASYI